MANLVNKRTGFYAAGLLLGVCVAIATAADGPKEEAEAEFANPETARLELFVGVWRLKETHFDSRGKELTSASGTEEIGWILDRHAIRRTYSRPTEHGVFKAYGLLSWSVAEGKYRGIWLDNQLDSGPTNVTAEWSQEPLTLILELESTTANGSVVRHRVVERLTDPEHRVATTYRIGTNGAVKVMEVRYARSVPCPGKIRMIFDD